jgi:hypothetical protein
MQNAEIISASTHMIYEGLREIEIGPSSSLWMPYFVNDMHVH